MMYKLIVYRLTGPIGHVFVGVNEPIDTEVQRALGVKDGDYVGYQIA